jgi:hypothetical protein
MPFFVRPTQMSREDAIERYIVVRWRAEEINHLGFLVEGLHTGGIQLPSNAPFTHKALKDTARTAFLGWFATLTDRSDKAVYAFGPLLFLFPEHRYQIGLVQKQCEALHGVLQRFRNNVAFHGRAALDAHINARRALREDDTFVAFESARMDFQRLMSDLIAHELKAIPELPAKLAERGISHHSAFANVASVVRAPSSPINHAFYSCQVLEQPGEEPDYADRGAARLVAVLALLALAFLFVFLLRWLFR